MWGVSDRGPGGGLLSYETRVQRFTVDVAANGAISNFKVAQTVKFHDAQSGGTAPLNGGGTQFDVWFDFALADPYANSLQCPIGTTQNCFLTLGGSNAPWTSNLALLPGVLHAYTASLNGFVSAQAVPEPGTSALALVALAGAVVARRRRGGGSRRDYFSRREAVGTRRN